MQVVQVDVLVIGGGQAALRAAIEARRQGARVALVCKGKAGAGGSSAISDTVHSAILAPGDSPDVFFRDMMKGGREINNPALVRALAEDCTERVRELQRTFGVEMHWERELVTPGHSFPRRCFHKGGVVVAITRRLRDVAQAFGVELYEQVRVVDLLRENGAVGERESNGSGGAWAEAAGRVCGALAEAGGRWVLFVAGSTVLASGGVGRLYAHSDNPADVTGEMIGMAWRHGVQLQDLEFVQFYPYRLVHPVNVDLYTKIFLKGAVMRNDQGVRFLEPYPRKELETRDIVCHEMFKQGNVWLDVSRVSPEDLQATSPRLAALLAKGYRGPLRMQPVEHYSIGGITIDAAGRTTLPGLYACGECTGGVHGANRLGGGALTEALVFGTRSGRAAAAEAVSPTRRWMERMARETMAERLPDLAGIEEQASAVRKRLQEIMWRQVGIERTEQGLADACRSLEELLETVQLLPVADMVQAARWIARCALARKESRGAHRLLDVPEQKEEWRGNWVVRGETVRFVPVRQDVSASGN